MARHRNITAQLAFFLIRAVLIYKPPVPYGPQPIIHLGSRPLVHQIGVLGPQLVKLG